MVGQLSRLNFHELKSVMINSFYFIMQRANRKSTAVGNSIVSNM